MPVDFQALVSQGFYLGLCYPRGPETLGTMNQSASSGEDCLKHAFVRSYLDIIGYSVSQLPIKEECSYLATVSSGVGQTADIYIPLRSIDFSDLLEHALRVLFGIVLIFHISFQFLYSSGPISLVDDDFENQQSQR